MTFNFKSMLSNIVICITEHAKFGWVLTPYFIDKSDNNAFFNANKRVLSRSQVDENIYLFENEEKILKTFEEITDQYIYKSFNKKKINQKDFYNQLKNEQILHHIRPFIEKRFLKILQLLPSTRFKIFIKSKKYNNIYYTDEVNLQDSKSSAIFNFLKTDDGIRYYLTIDSFKLTHQNPIFLTDQPCSLVLHKKLYMFHNLDSKKLQPFLSKEFIFVQKASEKKYFETFVTNAIKNHKVKEEGFKIEEFTPEKNAVISIEKDLKNNPVVILKFIYNNHIFLSHNDTKKLVLFSYEKVPHFKTFYRDFNWEKEHKKYLEELGLKNTDNSNFYLSNDCSISNIINWINQNYTAINDYGFSIDQKFYNKNYYLKTFHLNIKVNDESDWFDILGKIAFEGFEIPFISLAHHILNEIKEFELPNGEIFIIPDEYFAKYTDILKFGQVVNENIQLQKHHFNLIEKNIHGIGSELKEKIKELQKQKNAIDFEIPLGLNAKLRSYQIEGYQWMRFLQKNEFGGCLADDMGLGKTVQTITLLLSQDNEKTIEEDDTKQQLDLFSQSSSKTVKIPSLIIVPASLVDNWINEISKFAPKLTINNYTGIQRFKTNGDFSNYDIILTTYGIIRNESEKLSNHKFQYIVLDESQIIKNPNSKIYRSVKELNSNYRMVLTGTPIENSLADLWAQFNFFNEGLLGNFNFFKKEFLLPIERYHSEDAKEKLQNIIKPFILRRTKEQVEKDLPEITEQIIRCPMTENQESVYEEEKSKIRNTIFQNIGDLGIAKSSIHILQGLTKLRQLANHPNLIFEEENHESGKFNEIIRNIENVMNEGHKLLLFSSFVKHLEIFENYFKEQNIKYSKLTGESIKRGQIVNEFQNNDDIKIFLISLKAGGTGLNLTAADYVFILDPWWNPAAELQAVSRAHRIGQDKKVFLYRYITKDSIEEKILNLQQRKTVLSESVIETNNPLKNITEKEIEQLFN